jgi:hypothetical protein
MYIMCETCKCTIGKDEGCDNNCPCCNDPEAAIVWQSTLTAGMVKDMDPNSLEILIADLDDAVEATCKDWGVDG